MITETETRLSTTDVAKLVRRDLRAAFPAVKFRVRSNQRNR